MRLVVLACLLLSAEAQGAALVNVQFGEFGPSYTGAAVVGSDGDYWNFFSSFGADLPLMDSGDGGTGITLTLGSLNVAFGIGGAFEGTSYANLMDDYAYQTSGTGSMTISGLEPYANFDLYIYSQGDMASNGRTTRVDVNGVTADTTPTDASASTFILGQNYLNLAVMADGNGQLSISYSPLVSEADINAFQLVQNVSSTPEPGTLGLLLAGLAGLALCKRGRKDP